MQNKMFTKATLFLMLAGLGLNIALVWLTGVTGIPLYLDSIGTVLTAALGGLLPGIAVGFFSNLITSLIAVTPDPMTMYYAFLNVLIAVAAAQLSKKGLFRKWYGLLAGVVVFSLIGGALGSVVTLVLYGFSFGAGISAPLAEFFYDKLRFGEFAAQFTADMSVDLADKLVTVAILAAVLRLLPKKAMEKLPLGYLYMSKDAPAVCPDTEQHGEKKFRRRSIRTKIMGLILASTAILSLLGLAISCQTYRSKLIAQYSMVCSDAVDGMLPKIDGDRIADYLAHGRAAPWYTDTEDDLYDIYNNSDRLKYMYVYQILDDGCHVVFDLDSPTLKGEPPGTVIQFDKSFPYLEQTLAGEEIPYFITDDTYGWLLTVYKPVKDSHGAVVAYAAADIDMQEIKTDIYSFAISIASLLFGGVVILTAYTLWYCDRKLLEPMGILAEQARDFDYKGENIGNRVRDRHMVNTGDEIEDVFNAMLRTEDALEVNILEIKKKNREISQMQRNIIIALASMVENRDENTGEHIKRTAAYVRLIGRKLLEAGLYPITVNKKYVRELYDSAPLHDIGKVKIPDAILNKPGKLTAEEYELMKTHTTEGGNILTNSLSDIEDDSWLSIAVDMARCHHERWNGEGYPDGISGDDIPLCARIMAVSDVFDALVSKRSYKEAFSYEEAVRILREGAGTQFDPMIVSVFVASEKEIRRIMGSYDTEEK